MDKYSIFMNWNSIFLNVFSSQHDLKDNAIPVKIPESYFTDIKKLVIKFIYKSKRPRITNPILKNKNKFVRLTIPNFKTYCKPIVIKTE